MCVNSVLLSGPNRLSSLARLAPDLAHLFALDAKKQVETKYYCHLFKNKTTSKNTVKIIVFLKFFAGMDPSGLASEE